MHAQRLSFSVVQLFVPERVTVESVALAAQAADQLGRASCWVLDASHTVGFDDDVPGIIVQALEYARFSTGLKRFLMIHPSPIVRIGIRSSVGDAPVEVELAEGATEAADIIASWYPTG